MKRVLLALLCAAGCGVVLTAQTTRERAKAVLGTPVVEKAAPQPAAKAAFFGLADGTVVKLQLKRELNSKTVQDEELIEFEVIEDIFVDGLAIIPRGALAEGTIIDAQAARRLGRTGRIGVRLDWVHLPRGKRAPLRAISARSDGSRGVTVAENVALATTFFFPAAPFFLLMKGKEITLPKGTLATAFIDGEVALERDKFEPK